MNWLGSYEGSPRWLDLAVAVATVVAAFFALRAIQIAEQARDDAEAVRRETEATFVAERRRVFELDLLVQLSFLLSTFPASARDDAVNRATMLMLLIPAEELPLTRHWCSVSSTEETRARADAALAAVAVEYGEGNAARAALIQREIHTAIAARRDAAPYP